MPIDTATLRTDPLGAILEMEGDSAQIIPDPVNGYDRVIPPPKLLEEMAVLFADSIQKTDKDYEPIFAELVRNEKAYEGLSDLGETITVPLCKRVTNQQYSWVSTSILNKNPIITVKPIDGGSYEIPAEVVQQSPTTPVFRTQTLTAEDASKLYETYLEYKLTERLDFEQLVEDTVLAIHIGEAPTWWKITYDPKVRNAKRRAYQSTPEAPNIIVGSGIEEMPVPDGEAVRLDHVSMLNITQPVDENDEQTSAWLAEKTPFTNSEIWQGVKSGRFDFCGEEKVDPAEVRKVLGLAENMQDQTTTQQLNEIDMRVAQDPAFRHDVRTVWFFWPIKRTVKTTPQQITPEGFADADPNSLPLDGAQPETKSEEKIEIRSLCGTLHIKAKRFLNLYCNPYWHGKRPYVPFFLRKRPHRFSGTTSVGDIAPLQRLISTIFDLEIKNGVQQNVKIFLVRNNSATWRALEKDPVLKPGRKIPFDDPEDVNPVQLGSAVQSMSAEIGFLNSEADRLAMERDYTDIPGRTPAASIAQFENLAKMQPMTILRGVRRRISRGIEMYLQTIAQFHEYEVIPFLDPTTQTLVRKLIGFPRETIENHFSFHVTATGDEDDSQTRIEKTTILLEQTDKANEASLSLMNVALDPRAPAPTRQFAKKLLVRREMLYGDLVKAQRADWTKFIVTDEMVAVMMQQADQIFFEAQQEAMNAANVSAAAGGGDVSQVQSGQPGPGGLPPEPGFEGAPEPNASGDPFGGTGAPPIQ